jgi:rod shape-determining protein MreD
VRRAITLTIVIITAVLLQTTVFSQIELLGGKPDLLFAVTILMAMLEGPSTGAITGFASGMAQDFLLNSPKGITALTLTLLGYGVGMARQYILSPSPLVPVIWVFLGTAVGELFQGIVRFLLGQMNTSWGYLFKVILLASLYNAILTPLIYPVLRRVAGSSRTTRVFKW